MSQKSPHPSVKPRLPRYSSLESRASEELSEVSKLTKPVSGDLRKTPQAGECLHCGGLG